MANFVADIVSSGYTAPKEIIGTLSTTCVATLYCLISVPFFWAEASLGLLIMCSFDFLLMIAFVVVAVVLGKPLSYLDCMIIGKTSGDVDAASAFAFTQSIRYNIGNNANFMGWSGATRNNCFESKAVWGLSIALCILFACSALVLPALFAKQKRAAKNEGNAKAAAFA
ncbi:MAG: hypothetical protein M1831_006538 [Alyxoria varia]|nr:MAG: hypothetical protein M1831_006538 [Alyxoria varia]